MKVRAGFVSNSSSSSFVIYTKGLTREQYDFLNNIESIVKIIKPIYGCVEGIESWNIRKGDGEFSFYSSMDNFQLGTYLSDLGFDVKEEA